MSGYQTQLLFFNAAPNVSKPCYHTVSPNPRFIEPFMQAPSPSSPYQSTGHALFRPACSKLWIISTPSALPFALWYRSPLFLDVTYGQVKCFCATIQPIGVERSVTMQRSGCYPDTKDQNLCHRAQTYPFYSNYSNLGTPQLKQTNGIPTYLVFSNNSKQTLCTFDKSVKLP